MTTDSTSSEKLQSGSRRVLLTLLIGALLMCAPLLLASLSHFLPTCGVIIGPKANWALETFFDLLGKVGDACFIAGLLAIVVEAGFRTHWIQEVVRAASPKLIGRHLPEALHRALLRYFEINFVRPIWEIEYDITPIDGLPDFVKVATRIKGIVHNYGPYTEDFPFFAGIDPSPKVLGLGKVKDNASCDDGGSRFIGIRCGAG